MTSPKKIEKKKKGLAKKSPKMAISLFLFPAAAPKKTKKASKSAKKSPKNSSPRTPGTPKTPRPKTPTTSFPKFERQDSDPMLEYKLDIFHNLKRTEKMYMVPNDFLEKHYDISFNMRAILIDWLLEVCEEYHLDEKTFFIAVSLLNRFFFLTEIKISRGDLQPYGCAALLIAAKFNEIFPPGVDDFVYISDNTFSRTKLIEFETIILKTLKYEVVHPTSYEFLEYYCEELKYGNSFNLDIKFLATYVLEVMTLDLESVEISPSLLAAAALFYSLRVFSKNLDEELQEITEYTHKDIMAVLPVIIKYLKFYSRSKLSAMKNKFERVRYSKVSKLPILVLESSVPFTGPGKISSPKSRSPKSSKSRSKSPKSYSPKSRSPKSRSPRSPKSPKSRSSKSSKSSGKK